MKIGNFDIQKKIFIIAEIGNNHEGSFDVAVKMIEAAAHSGADAVKFQTIVPERLLRPSDTKRMEQLKRFAFSYEQFIRLKEVADAQGVLFLSTPFDVESAKFLTSLVPAFKIASGDNNFYPMMKMIARTGKPVILSTGFADLDQIRKSVQTFEDIWKAYEIKGDLALLHCISSYPVKPEEANLAAIQTLKILFPMYTIGYSDHTVGIQASIVAATLGARIIEKHFTIDKHYSSFRDHALSADPSELHTIVEQIRQIELLLGTGEKIIQEGERNIMQGSRRSIVATRDIPAHTIISEQDITWLRSGEGLSPGQEHLLIGRKVRTAVQKGELLHLNIVD